MAITEAEKERTIIASWVPTSLADQVKEASEVERRSVSSFVRHLIEDNFAAAAKAERPPGESFDLPHPGRGAGTEES